MNKKSLTYRCFPQIRFVNGEKRLWNPVVKKAFKFRPEERVRLEVVEFLNRRCGISLSRMSTEQGMRTDASENMVRTDIIVYGRSMKPEILVECKAPVIKLNERAALQIARYNTTLQAEQLLITNGNIDYIFSVDEAGLKAESISKLITQNEPERDATYWQKRGFIGNDDASILKLAHSLYDKNAFISFLEVPSYDGHPESSHYYRLMSSSAAKGWAVTLLSDSLKKTWLSGLLFENGSGTTIVSVDIEDRKTYYTRVEKQENPEVSHLSETDIKRITGGDVDQLYMWFERLLTEKI